MHVVITISRGMVVWSEGRLAVTKGWGKYIPRPPFGKTAWEGVDCRLKSWIPLGSVSDTAQVKPKAAVITYDQIADEL